jgi:hypothetical protein
MERTQGNIMKITSSRFLLLAIAGLALLSACGGGSDDSVAVNADPNLAGSEVPNSATSSSAGAVAFARQLAATSNDTAEPIRVGDAVLATSDTDEPVGI